MLNTRQLDAFRRVMEAGSVSRAAEIMGLTQPAVSKQIAALEAELGFALFHRERLRLAPTAEALIFHQESAHLFGQFRRLERLAGELKRAARGHLFIGGAPVAALTLLPPIIHRFQQQREGVSVSLQIQSSPKLTELAGAQLLDLAIGLLPMEDATVACETLFRGHWICVLPPGHRLAGEAQIVPQQLAGENFISLGDEDHTRRIVDYIFEEAGVARVLRTSCQLGMAACEMVRLGAGVTLMDPVTAYARANADLVVRPFCHPASFEMKLLLPQGRAPSALREEFVRQLRRGVEAWAATLPGAAADGG
jgi:DNA-binding transcriptional LysR family regulator